MVISCKTLLIPVFVFGFVLSAFSTITPSDPTPSVGCPDTFVTNIAGNSYQWEFGPNSYPETVSGAGVAFAVAGTAFLTPGNHTVRVFITLPGGNLVGDSTTVDVLPNPSPTTFTAPGDTVCIGNSIWFYASTTISNPTYAFFLNDSLLAITMVDSIEITPNHGDSVRVFTYNGICFSGSGNAIYPEIDSFASVVNSTANDTICSGYSLTFTAAPLGFSNYSFYNGGSLQQSGASNTWTTTQLGNGDTIYVIISSDVCFEGYSNRNEVILKPTPQMSLTVPDNSICQGTPVTFTASATQSATDSFIFFVNGVEVQAGNDNDLTYTTTQLNNGDSVTVEGSLNGCYSRMSAAIIMTVSPPPSVTLTSSLTNDSICQGQPVTFTGVPAGYSQYKFLDSGVVEQFTASNTFTTTALTPGNSISVVAYSGNCAPATSNSIAIVVIPAPQLTLPTGNLSACVSVGSDTLTGFAPTGGVWSGNGIIDDSTGVVSPSLAGAGTDSLTYTYTDPATQCSSTGSVAFTVFPLPAVSVTPSSPAVCSGRSVQLTASGATSYAWSPTAGLSDSTVANPVASPAATTTYVVTGTDNNGCSDTASSTVTVNQANSIDFTYQAACSGQPSTFTLSTNPPVGTTVEWEFGDGGSSTVEPTATHTYTSGNTYDVMLITIVGACTDTSSQQVLINQNAIANFYATPTVGYANDSNPPIQFVNESTGGQSYSWDFGDQTSSSLFSPAHVYTAAGLYTVTLFVTNQSGCSDSLTLDEYISINPLPVIFIPNAFAPDGYNKILHVYAEGLKFMDWKIFDRSGELVYESHDINADANVGWDGNYKGVAAPEGVYVYTLKAVFEDNSQRFYKGSITLLR